MKIEKYKDEVVIDMTNCLVLQRNTNKSLQVIDSASDIALVVKGGSFIGVKANKLKTAMCAIKFIFGG